MLLDGRRRSSHAAPLPNTTPNSTPAVIKLRLTSVRLATRRAPSVLASLSDTLTAEAFEHGAPWISYATAGVFLLAVALVGRGRTNGPAPLASRRSTFSLRARGVGVRFVRHEETPVATITQRMEVDASPAAVWSILVDVSRLPEISRSTTEVVTEGPLQSPGQTFEQTVRLGGRSWTSHWQVDEIVPERSLTISGSLPLGTPYTMTERLTAAGEHRTRLEICAEYELPMGALGRLAGRLGVERRARSELRDVIRGVAQLAQSAAHAPGS